jgi:hypothetical protein
VTDENEPHANSPEDIGYRSPPPAVMPRPQRRTTTMGKQTEATDEEPETLEGPRGFAQLFRQIDDGELDAEAAREVLNVATSCRDYARKYMRDGRGTLTITLSFASNGDTTAVRGEVKTKLPKTVRAGSTFFHTKGGNLTVENPRQQKLPLREVPASTTKTKDLSAEQPTRAL